MSKYRRIKYEDRCQIYALSKRGSSQESIAEVLGVSQSAVSREIHRNRGQRGYRFKQAEAKAQARQAIRSKPRKLTAPTRSKIEAKLRQMRWSPEQISGWLSEQGIKLSHERIYQMIWDDKRDGGNLWRSLRRRGKRYNKRAGKNAGRGLIPNRIDISEAQNPSGRLGGRHRRQRRTQRRLAHAGRAQNPTSQNHQVAACGLPPKPKRGSRQTISLDAIRPPLPPPWTIEEHNNAYFIGKDAIDSNVIGFRHSFGGGSTLCFVREVKKGRRRADSACVPGSGGIERSAGHAERLITPSMDRSGRG